MLPLLVAVLIGLQTGAASLEDAVRLAREGRHPEALRVFAERVDRDPGDLESRVWLGRLTLWMGRAAAAEAIFHAVLRESPGHVEAMLGLASARLARGDVGAALDVLRAAEAAAPKNAEVLAALARAHHRAGRGSLAAAYAVAAAALSGSPDARRLLEDVRRSRGHRVELAGFVEDFDRAGPEGDHADLAVNLRAADAVRVVLRGQAQRKFGVRDTRAGGGVEWRVRPDTAVGARALVGPDAVVLPEVDVELDAAHARGRFELAAGVRRLTFATADVTLLSPSISMDVSERLTVGGRYYLAATNFTSRSDVVVSHSWLARAALRAHYRVWLTAGYARGVENFETLTADRLGVFRAHTTSAGVRVELRSLTGVSVAFEHQRRSDGARMNRATVALVQRF